MTVFFGLRGGCCRLPRCYERAVSLGGYCRYHRPRSRVVRLVTTALCIGGVAWALAHAPHCAGTVELRERNEHEAHVLSAALSVGSPELCGLAYEPDECRDAYQAALDADGGEDAACEFPAACVDGDADYQ